jgi:nucleotide-binding universal stress UspA family protein
MSYYQKLLIATDLGFNTVALIESARELMDSTSHLTLLHVVRPMETTFFGTMPYIPILPIGDRDSFEKRVFEAKNNIFDAISESHNIDEKDCIIETGDPKDQITDFAQSNEYDLIITASTHTKQRKSYLGSTTKAIVENAHCDVLVVRLDH